MKKNIVSKMSSQAESYAIDQSIDLRKIKK